MSFQDETKARRDLDLWRDASEAHIRSDLSSSLPIASSPVAWSSHQAGK
jgi:hypothetical protein